MSIVNPRTSVEQLEIERACIGELEDVLGQFHDDPLNLRVQLELGESHGHVLIGIDDAGLPIRWSSFDRLLVRIRHDLMSDPADGREYLLERNVGLLGAEAWAVAHADELAWIHPRFRWKLPDSN